MKNNEACLREEWAAVLRDGAKFELSSEGIAVTPVTNMSPGMKANASFFSHKKWGEKYLTYENHAGLLSTRWKHATGSWNGKCVVDMGCGPGNLACIGLGKPKMLIGVDISEGALESATRLGYRALLADVHHTPLRDSVADLVTANAVLHHIDDVERVLAECARLVKPGGMLVTDEDPILCQKGYTGAVSLFQKLHAMVPISRVKNHPHLRWRYTSLAEKVFRHRTEIHFQYPGDGIDIDVFERVLEPRGFRVRTFPHAHVAGDEIFRNQRGKRSTLECFSQSVAGLDPDASYLNLSVMCIAVKTG